jgi:hypothetical protein
MLVQACSQTSWSGNTLAQAEPIKEDHMSRKNTTRKSMQRRTPRVEPLSMQELESRWDALRLHPETKDHLEHILQAEGVDLAYAATTALILELEREEPHVTRSLWGWVIEELRTLFLEEGCQHLIESGRLVMDALLTWTLVRGPVLVTRLALPLLILALLPLSLCLIHVLRQRRASGRG